jgi:hypothetical protein
MDQVRGDLAAMDGRRLPGRRQLRAEQVGLRADPSGRHGWSFRCRADVRA